MHPHVGTARESVAPSSEQTVSQPTLDEPRAAQVSEDVTEPEARSFVLNLDPLPSPLVILPKGNGAPLVVAAHGAGGSPEWQCEWLQTLTPPTPIALACLRGKPMLPYEGAFYYPEHHTLGKLFHETLSALGPILQERNSALHTYVGYSQGATMGALMLHDAERVPSNLLLVEGGYEGWTQKRCQSFERRGGRRVYFACGTNTCAKEAKLAVQRLLGAGVQAQLGVAPGAGHRPDGAVGEVARTGLAWLLSAP